MPPSRREVRYGERVAALPSAMWQDACLVEEDDRLRDPAAAPDGRRAVGRSATSPRRTAPSSVARCARIASAFRSASTSVARPPSNRSRTPSTIAPPRSWSGRVATTVPSATRLSGVVNTSSVGMLTTVSRPQLVVIPPESQLAPRSRPMRRSVPAPSWKWRARRPAASSVVDRCAQRRDVATPRLDGIVGIETKDRPERLSVGLDVRRTQDPVRDAAVMRPAQWSSSPHLLQPWRRQLQSSACDPWRPAQGRRRRANRKQGRPRRRCRRSRFSMHSSMCRSHQDGVSSSDSSAAWRSRDRFTC